MWLLKKLNDGSMKYLISESKIYTVGRKNCDITLDDDASISRKHCTLYISKQNECPFAVNTSTGVWVVDEQSKYGTYLKSNGDWVKINPKQNKKLSSGTVIKFGLMENVWSLEFKPFIACTSGVQTQQKKKIEISLKSIDGCLKSAWCRDCSIVIVNEITLTVKVVLALINGIPIVTSDYVEKVVESVKNQTSLPLYEDYRPVFKESILDASLVSLDITKNRKELFKGIKFVIPTKKQLETLREVIVSAGGNAELFSSVGNWERLAEENTVLLQLPLNNDTVTQELEKSFKEATSFLKNKFGRRIIPESEIAQAVAYSSVEKYCNPKSTCFNLIRAEKELDLGVSLVQETPETTKVKIPEPTVIPCSATIESEPIPTLPSQSSECDKECETSGENRKRIHSPNQLNEELTRKKARNIRSSELEEAQTVLENKTLQKLDCLNETGSGKAKKSTKTAPITSFFPKQNKSFIENIVPQQNSSKFWNQDGKNDDNTKRKLSTGGDDFENSIRKRLKIPQVNYQKQLTVEFECQNPKEVVEIVEKVSKNNHSAPSRSFRKISGTEVDNDFSDYIERGKMDILNSYVDDLNSTIFSLTIISPAYLKNDGSLIDPPTIPVNVKRFKKQKIHFDEIVVSTQPYEDEFSDGEWIEPHCG